MTDKAGKRADSAIAAAMRSDVSTPALGAPERIDLVLGSTAHRAWCRGLTQHREQIARYERRVARDPDDVYWQDNLAIAHANVGQALAVLGDDEAARSHFRTALTTFEKIWNKQAAEEVQRCLNELDVQPFAETENPDYYNGIMNDAAVYFKSVAAKHGLSVAELEQAIDNFKAAKVKLAARETTGGAEGKSHVIPSTDADGSVQVITREMLLGSVPPSLRSDGRQKYEFANELLDDPQVFRTEESIANKLSYKLRRKKSVTNEEKARLNLAKAFLGQSRTRQRQLTNG